MFMRRQFVYRPDEPVGSPEPTPPEDGAPTPTDEPAPSGTPEVDYQKRYDDLRPQYDRTQSELAALRQWQTQVKSDPAAQREFLKELGYDVGDDEDEILDDPLEELRRELAQLKQEHTQTAAERQIEVAETHAEKVFGLIGDKRGYPLDEDEQDAIIGRALTMPAGEDNMPPFQQAYDALEAIWAKREQRQAAKRRPTHQFSPNGRAGDPKPDRSTHEGRVAHMLEQLQDT